MITTLLVLARMLHIGSALVLVSLLFFRGLTQRRDASDQTELERIFAASLTPWLVGCWLLQMFSGCLWLWIIVAQMNDVSLRGALNGNLWPIVLEQTHFGNLWLIRLILSAGFGAALFLLGRSSAHSLREKTIWFWIALGLSGVLLASLAWAGHAASGTSYQALAISVDVVHLGVTAIWPGGLLPLALFLAVAARIDLAVAGKGTMTTLRRFSRWSMTAVALLILSGVINSCLLIPRLVDLVTSAYGLLLLAKVALFLVLIGLGGWNQLRLVPDLDSPESFPQLRRIVLLENGLTLVILLIIGAMGTMSPPPC